MSRISFVLMGELLGMGCELYDELYNSVMYEMYLNSYACPDSISSQLFIIKGFNFSICSLLKVSIKFHVPMIIYELCTRHRLHSLFIFSQCYMQIKRLIAIRCNR